MTGTVGTKPADGDITIEINSTETLSYGTRYKMALRLTADQQGNRAWTQGYQADPNAAAARQLVTDKRDWSGGFGAYLHNPEIPNRYATSVSVDCSVPRTAILGPLRHEAPETTGSEAFASVIHSACEFTVSGTTYLFICSDRYIYKLVNWSTTPTFTRVADLGSGKTSYSMVVFKDVMYIAVTGANKYKYTTDGSSFNDNTGASGNGRYATRFAVINAVLHKMYGQLHSTCDNDADAKAGVWTSESTIGNSTVQEILGLHDSVVVAEEDGYYNLDYGGNIHDIRPELKVLQDVDNGQRARVWHEKAFIPLLGGRLDMWPGDAPAQAVDPQLQQDYPLELPVVAEYSSVAGWVRALATHPEYLYASVQRQAPANDNHRILKLNEDYGSLIWHLMAEQESDEQGLMWVTGGSTSGPVLWVGQGAKSDFNYHPAYYILPKGRNPLQDSRCDFADSGTLYEPWDNGGYPSDYKLSNYLEVWCVIPTGGGITVSVIGDDGTEGITDSALADGYNRVNYSTGWYQKKRRVEFAFTTSDNDVTPQVTHWRDFCEVQFACRSEISCVIDVQSSASKGLYTAEEVNTFMLDLAKTTHPITVVDMWGVNWTMRPVRPYPQAKAGQYDDRKWNQAVQLAMLEEP